MALKNEEILTEAKNFFNFYKKSLSDSLRSSEKVIYIKFSDLAEFSHEIAEKLLEKPEEVFSLLELALNELGLAKNPRIRLLDLPQNNFVKIRNIRAKHLNS